MNSIIRALWFLCGVALYGGSVAVTIFAFMVLL